MGSHLTPEQVKTAEARASKEGYLRREPVALDQFLNASTGGNLDETISARSSRWAKRKNGFIGWRLIAKGINWGLSKIQRQHGERAQAGDLARAERVEEVEEKDLGTKPD